MLIAQFLSEFFPPKPTLTEADLPTLAGKTYFITGGAAGIGKELARMLYSANATVYIAGRSLANIEKATKEIIENPSGGMTFPQTGGRIVPLILDLGDLTTIKAAVQELEKKVTKLDMVLFNAGVMTPPVGAKTAQGYELQWGTNVVGHFLLQKLMMPLLLASAQDDEEPLRIIWVSSDGSMMSPSPDGVYWDNINNANGKLSPWNLYTQSKAGNVILAAETAQRYAPDNIITASLNPGHLKTELQRHSNTCIRRIVQATLLHDARYGALTELYAGFSSVLTKEKSGSYFIPWGREAIMAPHVKKGLENGSGGRLWELLDKETAQYQ
ncbi:NAD(P)-binding protein [Lophium mytilinum]|uniref:NAD(P)-binding protein n=1 Tax=Lophium mytilinum TaxID=390894 RepID=A0A6A6R0W5_9PEZI|nr:NAD(P)-binding protein [Lophium mytilinum]